MTVALQAVLGAVVGAAGGVLGMVGLRAYLPLRQAPLVHRVSAVGAVLAGLLLGLALGGAGAELRLIVAVVVVSTLLATLSLIDLATRRLPNLLVLLLLLWGLAQAPLGITNWRMALTGALFGAMMFGLLGAIGRGALGVGDVKLAIAIGAVLGLPVARPAPGSPTWECWGCGDEPSSGTTPMGLGGRAAGQLHALEPWPALRRVLVAAGGADGQAQPGRGRGGVDLSLLVGAHLVHAPADRRGLCVAPR